MAGDELLHRLEGSREPQQTSNSTVLRASARDQDYHHERHHATNAREDITTARAVEDKPAVKKDEEVREGSVLAAVLAEQRSVREEVAALSRSLQRIEALLAATRSQPPADAGSASTQHTAPPGISRVTGDVTA